MDDSLGNLSSFTLEGTQVSGSSFLNQSLARPDEASTAGRDSQAGIEEIDQTRHFVERALLDFGLIEEFEHQPARTRAECLRWIAGARNRSEEEDRVSHLLDALAAGGPLVPISAQWA